MHQYKYQRTHITILHPGWRIVDNLYGKYVHSPIQHIICNRNVFTNFLPCSHEINSNNETCLVICAVSLTWLMYTQISLILPSTRIQVHIYYTWYTSRKLGHTVVVDVSTVVPVYKDHPRKYCSSLCTVEPVYEDHPGDIL